MKTVILFLSTLVLAGCITRPDYAYQPPDLEQTNVATLVEYRYRNGNFTRDWGGTRVTRVDERPLHRTKDIESIRLTPGLHTFVAQMYFNSPTLEACPCESWVTFKLDFAAHGKYQLHALHVGDKIEFSILDLNNNQAIVSKVEKKFSTSAGTVFVPVVIY